MWPFKARLFFWSLPYQRGKIMPRTQSLAPANGILESSFENRRFVFGDGSVVEWRRGSWAYTPKGKRSRPMGSLEAALEARLWHVSARTNRRSKGAPNGGVLSRHLEGV